MYNGYTTIEKSFGNILKLPWKVQRITGLREKAKANKSFCDMTKKHITAKLSVNERQIGNTSHYSTNRTISNKFKIIYCFFFILNS